MLLKQKHTYQWIQQFGESLSVNLMMQMLFNGEAEFDNRDLDNRVILYFTESENEIKLVSYDRNFSEIYMGNLYVATWVLK